MTNLIHFGFSAVLVGKSIKFRWTPGVGDIPLVTQYYCNKSGIAAIIAGRLYYPKDSILSELDYKTKNYAESIVSIYSKLGIQGLEKLEGDFSAAIWDGDKENLIGIRDVLGSYPLFFIFQDGLRAISTNIRYLLKLVPSSLDQEYIANYIMAPYANELRIANTPFSNIQRILPANVVELKPAEIKKRSYWTWKKQYQNKSKVSQEEAGEQLLKLLFNSVEQRIVGTTSSHLSGGMDSTSISIIAAEIIRSGKKNDKLQTLSAVYEQGTLAEETKYINNGIEAIRECNIPTKFSRILADDVLDFDNFERSPMSDEPYGHLFRTPLFQSLINEALKFGSSTILTGIFAEPIVDGNAAYIADHLRKLHLYKALHEASKWAKARRCSTLSILLQSGFGHIFPLLKEGGFRTILNGYGKWSSLGDFSIPPWIKKSFSKNYDLHQIAQRNSYEANENPSSISWYRQGIKYCVPHWMCWYLTAPHGIHIAHPFFDQRIINFCLGLPNEIKSIPGQRKPLLQSAMKNILPKTILHRYEKGHFNDIYWRGLLKKLNYFEKMISSSKIKEIGLIDTNKLIDILRKTALGDGDVIATGRINNSLSLISWYDNLDKYSEGEVSFENEVSYDWNKCKLAVQKK